MAGFTLIETLFALAINALIVLSISSLFAHLHQALIIENNHDLAYVIVNLTEDVNTALSVECDHHTMTLAYPEKVMTYYLDHGRLVKSPGFDVYLHELDDLSFDNDGMFMYISLKRGNHSERFQIGTYFRPRQERICQPDSSLDTELFDGIIDELNTND